MFTRTRAGDARGGVRALQETLVDLAARHVDWPMPGYTHLQRAQPVYLGHHLLAYFWMLERDAARFRFAEEQAGAALPLGAGALAGVKHGPRPGCRRARVSSALARQGRCVLRGCPRTAKKCCFSTLVVPGRNPVAAA